VCVCARARAFSLSVFGCVCACVSFSLSVSLNLKNPLPGDVVIFVVSFSLLPVLVLVLLLFLPLFYPSSSSSYVKITACTAHHNPSTRGVFPLIPPQSNLFINTHNTSPTANFWRGQLHRRVGYERVLRHSGPYPILEGVSHSLFAVGSTRCMHPKRKSSKFPRPTTNNDVNVGCIFDIASGHAPPIFASLCSVNRLPVHFAV
jgi:hypothetical protein